MKAFLRFISLHVQPRIDHMPFLYVCSTFLESDNVHLLLYIVFLALGRYLCIGVHGIARCHTLSLTLFPILSLACLGAAGLACPHFSCDSLHRVECLDY